MILALLQNLPGCPRNPDEHKVHPYDRLGTSVGARSGFCIRPNFTARITTPPAGGGKMCQICILTPHCKCSLPPCNGLNKPAAIFLAEKDGPK